MLPWARQWRTASKGPWLRSSMRMASLKRSANPPPTQSPPPPSSTIPPPPLSRTTPPHPPPCPHPRRAALWLRAAHGLLYGAAILLGAHVFLHYFYTAEPTYGISMLPTIASFGDWVIISKYYRRGRGVEVGDLVSFHHPVRQGEYAVKRIIGLSGDFVLMNIPGKSDAMIQVPEGHCWVVGDNLLHSRDSRIFGPLPMALIVGKAIMKFHRRNTWLPTFSWLEGRRDLTPVSDEDYPD